MKEFNDALQQFRAVIREALHETKTQTWIRSFIFIGIGFGLGNICGILNPNHLDIIGAVFLIPAGIATLIAYKIFLKDRDV